MNSPTIENCKREQSECDAYFLTDGDHKMECLIGWMDWEVECRLLEREAFEHEYRTEFKRTVNFVSKWTYGCGIDPEDIAQSAWTRAWEKRSMYRQDAKFSTWVLAIALNIFRVSLRRYDPLRGHFQIDGAQSYEFHFGDPLAMRIIASEFPVELAILEAFYVHEIDNSSGRLSSPRVKVMRAKRKIRDRLATVAKSATVREIRKVEPSGISGELEQGK